MDSRSNDKEKIFNEACSGYASFFDYLFESVGSLPYARGFGDNVCEDVEFKAETALFVISKVKNLLELTDAEPEGLKQVLDFNGVRYRHLDELFNPLNGWFSIVDFSELKELVNAPFPRYDFDR